MSDSIRRREFLGTAARTAAAGSVVGRALSAAAGEAEAPATQPAAEDKLIWRNKQPTMTYARLGRTNFMVSRMIFGAGGVYSQGGSTRLLEMAIERGMNDLDTGRPYAKSEQTLAPIAKKHRDKLWICSKAGDLGWPGMKVKRSEDAKAARMYTEQLDDSLKALGTDCIDCYMVQGVQHDWVVTMDALYEAFEKAKKAGKVRSFGLATHTGVATICRLAAKTGRYDVVMLAINPNSADELKPTLDAMHKADMGIVSMKNVGPIRGRPQAFDEKYGDMFAGQKLSPYQRAYAYMLFRVGVHAFNTHAPTITILEENIKVPTLKLSKAELARLERRVLAEARGACRHCGACSQACPKGIRVADMLRSHSYLHNYRDPNAARELYESLGPDHADLCAGCRTCVAACPESIDHPAVISSLRVTLARDRTGGTPAA